MDFPNRILHTRKNTSTPSCNHEQQPRRLPHTKPRVSRPRGERISCKKRSRPPLIRRYALSTYTYQTMIHIKEDRILTIGKQNDGYWKKYLPLIDFPRRILHTRKKNTSTHACNHEQQPRLLPPPKPRVSRPKWERSTLHKYSWPPLRHSDYDRAINIYVRYHLMTHTYIYENIVSQA